MKLRVVATTGTPLLCCCALTLSIILPGGINSLHPCSRAETYLHSGDHIRVFIKLMSKQWLWPCTCMYSICWGHWWTSQWLHTQQAIIHIKVHPLDKTWVDTVQTRSGNSSTMCGPWPAVYIIKPLLYNVACSHSCHLLQCRRNFDMNKSKSCQACSRPHSLIQHMQHLFKVCASGEPTYVSFTIIVKDRDTNVSSR